MRFIKGLSCVLCGKSAPPPRSAGTCPECGDAFAILDVDFDLPRVAKSMTRESLENRPFNHWRYHELLPIEPDEEAFAWPVG